MWWVPSVSAAPRFVAEDADRVLAEAAWEAAVTCTGRTPTTGKEATIVRDLPEDKGAALSGLAMWPADAPAQIRLTPRARPTTLAHEVAHAWIHRGPRGLVEGRTELLTLCIQRTRPDVFRDVLDPRADLDELPDLLTWDPPLSMTDTGAETGDAYAGAFRMFRAIAQVVPPEQLWGDGVTGWSQVLLVLDAAGEKGARVSAVLRGGALAQRVALRDPDLDGLTTLFESLTDTDPARWDTDGDGWWDGATEAPPDAVPLPRVGLSVCLPMVPEGAELLDVKLGGELGGLAIDPYFVTGVDPGMLFVWSNASWDRHPGGVWLKAAEEVLVPNARCALRRGVTVRADGPVAAGNLGRLADRVREALDAISAETGLVAPNPTFSAEGDGQYVTYATSDRNGLHRARVLVPLRMARNLDDPDTSAHLARQMAAMAAVTQVPQGHSAAAASALVRAVFPASTSIFQLGASTYAVGPWRRAARECPEGWLALVAGRCPSPAS